MVTISVIIPAYNAERTILETIESVRKQTFKDLEIIVINDGSTDKTATIVNSISDRRIQVFDYANGGLPTARNRGIIRAQGKYISFLDADDLWTEDKLEKQLAALHANPEFGVAYSWIVAMVEAKDKSRQVSFISGKKVTFHGNILGKLLIENFIGNGSNILAKTEAIKSVGSFDVNLLSCEDWDYYLRLAAKYHFALVPEHHILYRKTPGTMTTDGSRIERFGLKVINKAYQNVSPQFQYLQRKSIANLYRYCGKIYVDRHIDRQDLITAKQKLWQAIKLEPLILFTKDSFILLTKIILKQLLPSQIINSLIASVKKPFEMKNIR